MADIERSAMRAQLLYEALSDTPVASVEQRLAKVGELEQPELALALREQLVVQRRMQEQLQRFDGEMERMVVELDTVRVQPRQHRGLRRRARTRSAWPSASAPCATR